MVNTSRQCVLLAEKIKMLYKIENNHDNNDNDDFNVKCQAYNCYHSLFTVAESEPLLFY